MKKNDKRYFAINNIKDRKIIHAFFSKKNGYSKNNFFSLNCSLNSKDNKKIVEKNIQLAKKILGISNKKIKFLNQNHSNKIAIIDNNNFDKKIIADGSITKNKNIALAILTADCAPIFIFNQSNTHICSLHAGWRGCLKNIIKESIKIMKKKNIKINELRAIVGPCLGKKNFEVDDIFKRNFLKKNNIYQKFFYINKKNKKIYFDMRGLINFQLKNEGVNKISNILLDTYSNDDLFFSQRRSSHKKTLPTGRMINIISFNDQS